MHLHSRSQSASHPSPNNAFRSCLAKCWQAVYEPSCCHLFPKFKMSNSLTFGLFKHGRDSRRIQIGEHVIHLQSYSNRDILQICWSKRGCTSQTSPAPCLSATCTLGRAAKRRSQTATVPDEDPVAHRCGREGWTARQLICRPSPCTHAGSP